MGCVHIYCGDGKGKTTAATGLAVRAAGRDKRVLIARFLKTDDSGEVISLSQMKPITVLPCTRAFGFYSRMSEVQKQEAAGYYQELFNMAWDRAVEEDYDMLILDEIMAACNYHLVPEEWLVERLQARPETLETVLTGRDPSERLLELADYVSEIQMRKHPFTEGVMAREGIEY